MEKKPYRRIWLLIGVFIGTWLVLRYVYPIIFPFLLGWALAALAEPGVKFLQGRLHFRRGFASALSVTAVLAGLLTLLILLAALGYRESMALMQGLPGLVQELTGQVEIFRDWTLGVVARMPDGIAGALEEAVRDLFAGGSVLISKAADTVLGFAGNLMSGLPDGALLLGTAVVSGFMISAQLPSLSRRVQNIRGWARFQNACIRMKQVVGKWLRAQVRLSGVTFAIVWLGFLMLGVDNSFLLALVTAVVDAVPMLGTGIILIPWCLFALLRGQTIRALGLAGLCVAAMVTRSALEPKLVGKHLGINPLLTLVALYAGFRIWGVTGMILAPILTVMAKELTTMRD